MKKNEPMFIILIKQGINIYIYIYIYFFFLALSYSAQPQIVVHCSNEAKKNSFSSTAVQLFLCFGGVKIVIQLFSSIATSALTKKKSIYTKNYCEMSHISIKEIIIEKVTNYRSTLYVDRKTKIPKQKLTTLHRIGDAYSVTII